MPTSGLHICIRGCTRTHVHTHHHTSTWKFYGRMGTGDGRHSIILQRGLGANPSTQTWQGKTICPVLASLHVSKGLL